MKKGYKIFLFTAVLLLFVYIIFSSRINGTLQVYHLIGDVTSALGTGSDHYNLTADAGLGRGKEKDTLHAFISYREKDHFLGDIQYNQNRYVIYHHGDSTRVLLRNAGLLITGKNDTAADFDAARLLGEIFENYPGTADIPSLPLSKRAGLAAWLLFHGHFSTCEINGTKYTVVGADDLAKDTKLFINNRHRRYLLKTNRKDRPVTLSVRVTERASAPPRFSADSLKKLVVRGDELNTAVYRGALRAGEILLENYKPPKPDGIDRRWGKGMLTYVNGNRVFIAKGTHREIGRAHGALLKNEIRKLVDATLYTINWVYTMEKGHWFLDDLREAYRREAPFIPVKYKEEMEGMAETSGITPEEIRLTNVFPALFHCSGFALFDSATVNGTLYHGRILDYITDLGLQYYALIQVLKPTGSYAFVNVGFAGFIGSVTGMNENQVTFGEMGGRGEGDWDGMPMAFLVREGLERAKTLDDALKIFRNTPRTCEYYYVISDGKIPDARGLATSPQRFEVIKPGQYHPQLPEPVKDAVLMSAGDRYKKLVERVKKEYGTIDAQKAIRLMDRPVAMKSALHTVLFAPQSLELWVANAGPHTPAPMNPYTHYDMMNLLQKADR